MYFYKKLTDGLLRQFIFQKSEKSREVVTTEKSEKLVEDKLRINVTDKDVRTEPGSLFVSYQSLLNRNGLEWLTKENEEVAAIFVLSAI